MKLLLDENLPHEFRLCFPEHDRYTVAYMKWAGVTNGDLLRTAVHADFEVLLTKDAGIEYQHDHDSLPLSIIVMRSRTNAMKEIIHLVPAIKSALAILQPRTLIRVG